MLHSISFLMAETYANIKTLFQYQSYDLGGIRLGATFFWPRRVSLHGIPHHVLGFVVTHHSFFKTSTIVSYFRSYFRCNICKEGYTGRACDVCDIGYYGNPLDHTCQKCDCNPEGSNGASCDKRGRCLCRGDVRGDKCDTCPVCDNMGF